MIASVSTGAPASRSPSASERRQFPVFAMHRVAVHTIMCADVFFSSRLYLSIFPDFAQRVLLSTLLIFSSFYVGLALLRGHWAPVLLAVLACVLIIGQIYVFQLNWGMEPNWTGAAQYSVFLCFVPFFIISRDGMASYVARALSFYALLYAAFYISFTLAYHANLIPAQIVQPLMLNDVERGERIYAYEGALAYSWYAALCRVQERADAKSIVALLVSALANALTLSRVYLACMILISALGIVRAPRWFIRIVCLLILFIVSGALLYGMFDTRWNPFYVFASGDSSGLGRAVEYQVAQEIVRKTPLFGIGLVSFTGYSATLTGIPFFSAGDLGIVGVLLNLGVTGVLLFAISSLIATAYINIVDKPYSQSLFLMSCTLALYGSIAPVIFEPGGVFYFGIILGMWLSKQ